MSQVNSIRLFNASCFALVTTAMAFAIRAGIVDNLTKEFGLSFEEVGYITSMAFLGFPVATIIGGPLYNTLGPRKMAWIAFIGHLLGIILTIMAGGFWTLIISTFLIGFANGTVEAAFNPMIATLYKNNQTTMFNKFHVWFPGGIVIGSLISYFFKQMGLDWQMQVATMLIPTAIYAYLFWGQAFPEEKLADASTSDNITAMLNPIYLLFFVGMILTANAELSTTGWAQKLLGNAGASPMLVLALITGLMAVGRYFGGPLIHRFKPIGVLLGSAIVATIGIGLLSVAEGPMIYIAAIVFAIGVCYFWPTMLGAVAEYAPKTGATGLSILGGIGMFATGIMQPIIGSWLDTEKDAATVGGIAADQIELVAGQATLDNLAVFPALAVVLFVVLFYMLRNRQAAH